MTIIHRTWFNTSEQSLQLFAGFNFTIHQISGVYLDGNLHIDYIAGCHELSCAGESYDTSLWSMASRSKAEGTRCETIRVTIMGHRDTDGGMIKFHLFHDDLSSELISAIAVDIIGKIA